MIEFEKMVAMAAISGERYYPQGDWEAGNPTPQPDFLSMGQAKDSNGEDLLVVLIEGGSDTFNYDLLANLSRSLGQPAVTTATIMPKKVVTFAWKANVVQHAIEARSKKQD